MKQNLANSIILPPKNGGLKAWSHSVRKANCICYSRACLKCFNCLQAKLAIKITVPSKMHRMFSFKSIAESERTENVPVQILVINSCFGH